MSVSITMDSQKRPAVSNVGAWGMNIVSFIALIMANKQLMSSNGFGFSFAMMLTGFHFVMTALVGLVLNRSASRSVPLWDLFWFSIIANMSITGMNFSLKLNSVGFYQISKLSIILVVCMIEFLLYGKYYSPRVIMFVFVVAPGVGVCIVTDVNVNMKGLLCACLAVFCTSL